VRYLAHDVRDHRLAEVELGREPRRRGLLAGQRLPPQRLLLVAGGTRGVDHAQPPGSQRSRLAAAHQHATVQLVAQRVERCGALARDFCRVGVEEHRQQLRLTLPQPGQVA